MSFFDKFKSGLSQVATFGKSLFGTIADKATQSIGSIQRIFTDPQTEPPSTSSEVSIGTTRTTTPKLIEVAGVSKKRGTFLSTRTEADLDKMFNNAAYKLLRVEYDNGPPHYFTMNDNNIEQYKNLVRNGFSAEAKEQFGSEELTKLNIRGIKNVSILPTQQFLEELADDEEEEINPKFNSGGDFFKYINNTKIDLTDFGILRPKDSLEFIREPCLIQALRQAGESEDTLNYISTTYNMRYFPTTQLKGISEYIGKTIIVSIEKSGTDKNAVKRSFVVYGPGKQTPRSCFIRLNRPIFKKEFPLLSFEQLNQELIDMWNSLSTNEKDDYREEQKDPIKLGLFENHFFIDKPIPITQWAVRHYDEVIQKADPNRWEKTKAIYKNGRILYQPTPSTSSFNVIRHLFYNGHFISNHPKLTQLPQFGENKAHIPLDNMMSECEQKFQRPYKSTKNLATFFSADIESDVSSKHTPIMIGIASHDNKDRPRIFIRKNEQDKSWLNGFLHYIYSNVNTSKKAVVYFHNLRYDLLTSLNFLKLESILMKDNIIYRCFLVRKYNKISIEFRDSYQLIPEKLSNFSKMLDLKHQKKEAIAYKYYKVDNMSCRSTSIKKYADMLKNEEERQIFKDAVKPYCNTKYMFDPVHYYIDYLVEDVNTLREGLCKMKILIDDFTEGNVDMYTCLTKSTLGHKYMLSKGIYEGVASVGGNLREYIGRAVIGGMVQVLPEIKNRVIEGPLSDFDGVSLYPSAMARLGIPLGLAKKLEDERLDDLDYYIVTIKINSVGKHQQLPFISYKDDTGNRIFTNDPPLDNKFIVDKYTLEDWVKYHAIDYTKIEGIFWNNGFNIKIGPAIEEMFKKRRIYQKQNNEPMQKLIKIMMNSIYGKTITKKSYTNHVIVDNTRMNYHVNKYNELIHSMIPINDKQFIVKKSTSDTSHQYSHAGVGILSMAKRIMHEVFDIANTYNMQIFYTDTDSMHIRSNHIPKLAEMFQKIHHRELIGKDLGQFHDDFKLTNSIGPVIATKSIFIMPKTYMDILSGHDSQGDIVTGQHVRMKGIPEDAFQHHVDKYYNGDKWLTMLDVANGKSLNIDLVPPGKFRPQFKGWCVTSLKEGEFMRRLETEETRLKRKEQTINVKVTPEIDDS